MNDPMRGMFHGFDIISSGLNAEMQRAEIVAANLSNMHRTGNKDNEPYRRRGVVFEELLDRASGIGGVRPGDPVASGVKVGAIYEDMDSPFRTFRDPGHPDADEEGWVMASNVDMFRELVDLSIIERSFQANLAAMRTYRTMVQNSVSLISRS